MRSRSAAGVALERLRVDVEPIRRSQAENRHAGVNECRHAWQSHQSL